MRVLILFAAILACATAAPSVAFFAPVSPIAYSVVPFPAAIPTISPDDLQAAAINAKVQLEDHVRAAADQARELTEQASENNDEGVIEAKDLGKEMAEESFWAAEEKKWQAMDALKTAEARADGSIASMASEVAKAAYSVPTTVLAQSGLSESSASIVAETKILPLEGAKVEEQKEKAEGEEKAAVKSVEEESKPVENVEKSVETAQVAVAHVQSSALVKAGEVVKEENPAFISLAQTHPAPVVSSAFVAQPWLYPGIAPISYLPGLKTFAPSLIPSYKGQLWSPTYFRAAW